MNKYFTIYPSFEDFAKKLTQLDLSQNYKVSNREFIYNRLRLPIKTFEGKTREKVHNLIYDYFELENFSFSIIESSGVSQIHTDTNYKKEAKYQRYCNLVFPLSGDFTNRITFWPNLDKQDFTHCFKNSYVQDSSLKKYENKDTWCDYITHCPCQPVLINTSLPHAASGSGTTLFAYITLDNKTYEESVDLYNAISNSATT